ncbi:helix-turn-helix transcriptional regulator [Actinomadura rudentiformis]|uniref:Helix-turn-helix domain-containing protein n=1 Tax=Actinomadura rudentiformis TaxID=359158 RepID=A0A6H9YYP1_9ACTN|nr:helix-turn-helix transcriptional regulator [Actinomadura rudentiformis]KAB2346991.1 helix-turn-helix domain-containing protein [Actinomadura rudentiformis]
MDKDEFAAFLRTRRERLRPADVGLPAGRRRRTPGLRREEVAVLAAISVDYYTRLEQSRGPHPSRQVLAGLAQALCLSGDERTHLYRLAGELPDGPAGPRGDVSPGMLQMLHRLDAIPALIIDAKFEVLAWNDLGAALITDFSTLAPKERNLARHIFLDSTAKPGFGVPRTERYARDIVSDLRAASARYPGSLEISELVAELLDGSTEFAELWADHEVGAQRTMCTTIDHPQVGPLVLCCEMLSIPDRDQRLVLYTAEPGSSSYEALRLLKVIGTQDLTTNRR